MARLRGFARRFWQGSTDHRGVPGAPGRVVTLVESPGDECWGVAYRVEAAQVDEVVASLDLREQDGYARRMLLAEPAGGTEALPVLVYVGTPDNPRFLGPAPLEELAEQICRARGPSGPNYDYVLRLRTALAELAVEDEHVLGLAARIEARLAGEGPRTSDQDPKRPAEDGRAPRQATSPATRGG